MTDIDKLILDAGAKPITFRCKLYKTVGSYCPCEDGKNTCKELGNQEPHEYKITKENLLELIQAQSYKADAEKYKELQKINCPVEGLSIRLEYRDGDIIFCNKRSFSILEVKHLPTITDQIRWSANWLWDGIEKAINDEAVKEGKS